MKGKNFDLRLRPHHIIDIITGYGNNVNFQPHPYGHSQHKIAEKILPVPDLKIELVLGSDDICSGCIHLAADGRCNDVLSRIKPSPSKQAYNDLLDSRLFDLFNIMPGHILKLQEYLEIIDRKIPGIESICTHPKENPERRLHGLINGLVKLGIRAR